MYSYKLVEGARKCAGCGTVVTNRLAGHCYADPMCDSCFRQVDPELANAVSELQPVTDVRALEAGAAVTCCNCGDRLSGRFAGHHLGGPLCVACLRQRDLKLALLLLLEEAVLEAAESGRYADDLLNVAVWYLKALERLDAESEAESRSSSLIRFARRSS